jgi:uncharacterized membrane protein (DUF2068 family)
MRGRPLGVVVSSIALAVVAIGAVAFGLFVLATSRNVEATGLMGPFGLALVTIIFAFSAIFAAIALWQLESWGWPVALVVGIVAVMSSIIGLIAGRHWPLVIGIALGVAVVAGLVPRSVRRTYRT